MRRLWFKRAVVQPVFGVMLQRNVRLSLGVVHREFRSGLAVVDHGAYDGVRYQCVGRDMGTTASGADRSIRQPRSSLAQKPKTGNKRATKSNNNKTNTKTKAHAKTSTTRDSAPGVEGRLGVR